ncbi:unnamed protein product [Allacma fusca]|uniref:Uncharacterized protein n=1 Tax=Allacma fusca TaxID=39272 RepID=A0A8J2MDB3_9HEXA|nr:unnamed protein product [Allacma fusca]
MPRYVWRPKEPPYFPQTFAPQKQPPFPPGLRFLNPNVSSNVKPDVIFEKQIDWWAPDAPYPYVDPRDGCRKKLVGETIDDGPGPSHADPMTIPVSDQGPSDLEPLDQESHAVEQVELPHKTRGQKQKERRTTPAGRSTQRNRRNGQRYLKKMLIRSGTIIKNREQKGTYGHCGVIRDANSGFDLKALVTLRCFPTSLKLNSAVHDGQVAVSLVPGLTFQGSLF